MTVTKRKPKKQPPIGTPHDADGPSHADAVVPGRGAADAIVIALDEGATTEEAAAAGLAAVEAAMPEVTIPRPEPDEDEREDDDEERVTPETAEDAAARAEDAITSGRAAEAAADVERGLERILAGLGEGDGVPMPTLTTDAEHAAYTCGYRAGESDPGWLLELAELRRPLGSWFTEEERVAWETMSGDDYWSRWVLGYADAVAQRVARPKVPPPPDDSTG